MGWRSGVIENKGFSFFSNYVGNVFFKYSKRYIQKNILIWPRERLHLATLRVSDKEFSNPKLKFPLKVNEVFGHLVISFMATLLVVLTQIACGK